MRLLAGVAIVLGVSCAPALAEFQQLLEERIKLMELPREAYEWYLDLRRFGTVPHAGFGMGLERTVTWICGLAHLREAIPYPRLLNRNYP